MSVFVLAVSSHSCLLIAPLLTIADAWDLTGDHSTPDADLAQVRETEKHVHQYHTFMVAELAS